ncbi:sarcosine oxidase subunit gamma [uncultured Bosea sp.]|uniref:sarcosine oxidase subunit gamma n=1 Tax=uncultured Bosea sp. TaxID=211457 RepID=UPI0025CF0B49|nr:sarcosine oxidase subunit gamma family protein [uncultured Bosea sp.]
MAETATSWDPRGAWAGIAQPGSFGAKGEAGVFAIMLEGFGLASVIAEPDTTAALSQTVEALLGLTLPPTPRIARGPAHDIVWAGPDQWLLRTASRNGFTGLLSELSAHAAVSEQSDARAALRLSGPRARDVLAKGVMLDLHPTAFAIGDVALTNVAYVGAHLWRLDDAADGPVFEILLPRSMAGSFWSWFVASAREFGCRVASGRG